MKKLLFLVFFALLTFQAAYAQKFGYVDSEFIMSKVPAYTAAQKEVDKLSANWQKDIENRYAAIDKMYKAYQAEEVLLTDEMKKRRQNEIVEKEREVKEYQKSIFGFEGQLFKKRQELIKPVQDEVYDAIEKVAKQKQLQIIFDKSGGLVMLYTNPVHDYTEYVLEALGLASTERNSPGKAPVVRPTDTPAAAVTDVGEDEASTQPKAAGGAVKRTTQTTKSQPKKK
ncbi:OmpH family outer membrane protein [Adhaeribacter aquaticus]|uniref:OmpH family outer membrane protein n=1 Tax=Adhaeribacter aquaticus TaxID=299567 RepID=UPI00041B0528|nr:OmpH family outer membrane protein [Adhaeribacter aquaticus]